MMKLFQVLLVAAERIIQVLLHILNVLLLGQLFSLEPAVGSLDLLG